MGAAARDVCMQDPNRLARWPDICRTCNEKTRSSPDKRKPWHAINTAVTTNARAVPMP
jgi:hypothetical protein